jgi:hypothetical protein
MCSCTTYMTYRTISAVAGLCAVTLACREKTLSRLEPTIEEARPLTGAIRFSDQPRGDQLVRGFYELQGGSWRWTAPQFDVLLGAPANASARGARLFLEFNLPDPSIESLKNVTVTAKVNNVALPSETYTTSGLHEYRHEAPPAAFSAPDVIVEFSVDKFLTPAGDGRNLALVVTAVGLEPK